MAAGQAKTVVLVVLTDNHLDKKDGHVKRKAVEKLVQESNGKRYEFFCVPCKVYINHALLTRITYLYVFKTNKEGLGRVRDIPMNPILGLQL